MYKLESIGQYHDAWAWVLLSAPDNFKSHDSHPVDQATELRNAFQWLKDHFAFAERKVKDQRLIRILREMLDMSYEAYVAGDTNKGAHVLQECEGMIWSKQALRFKHAVEAEQRAYGDLVLFKHIRTSRFPYEGTEADLHEDQAALLAVARVQCHKSVESGQDFESFAWAITSSGETVRLSTHPEFDQQPVLPPLEKSWRGCYNRLRRLAAGGSIRACVHASAMGSAGNGNVTYILESLGAPRIDAIEGISLLPNGTQRYERIRFHLNEPHFFEDPVDAAQQRAAADRLASLRSRPGARER